MSDRFAPSPADVATLARALEEDAQRPAAERAASDTRIVGRLRETTGTDAISPVAWLEVATDEDRSLRETRERAQRALDWAGLGVAGLGALLGAGAAWGALTFDGTGRVNVITVLAVFVVVPTLLLIPWALAALPRAAVRWLPGASALVSLCRTFSLGRLGALMLRLLPARAGDTPGSLGPLLRRHQTLHGSLQKWLLLRWSQSFAIAFQLTALAAAIALVVFTDLAFGWSSTLTTGDATEDARRLHRLLATLATPWAALWPDAVPSLALVEESRYFRAAARAVSATEAARLGGWWPFVLLAMLTYGVLPRVVTFALAHRALRRAVTTTLRLMPGWSALERRLHRARVQTAAIEPETGRSHSIDAANLAPLPDAAGDDPVAAVINWSGVPLSDAALRARFGAHIRLGAAGGASELAADERVIVDLAATARTGGDVAIVVKAWEPPMLEFVDFVQALRRALGPGRGIQVVPLGLDEAEQADAPTPAHAEVWRRKVERLGDPWTRLSALPREATP